jgi:hypothetical protein
VELPHAVEAELPYAAAVVELPHAVEAELPYAAVAVKLSYAAVEVPYAVAPHAPT